MLLLNQTELKNHWVDLASALSFSSEFWRSQDTDVSMVEDLADHTSFADLLANGNRVFDRGFFDPGHITGSALVVNESWTMVLLTHHKKLDRWLQLGGHSDGESFTADVAFREALEESGLTRLKMVALENTVFTFDVDIHSIPARKADPTHKHFDVRFLVEADESENVQISDESNDVKWFSIEEASKITDERSMHRQFEKLNYLRSKLK